MPYFVYKITEMPIRMLEKLEQHAAFREASSRAKQLRGELGAGSACMVKVIFAETELHAEDLLNQVRDGTHSSEDD